MNVTDSYNPARLFELYLSTVPDGRTMEGRAGGYLFSKPKAQSLTFNLHNPKEMTLFQPNQKGDLLKTQFAGYNQACFSWEMSCGKNVENPDPCCEGR